MRVKSIPKRKIPTTPFDEIKAQFEDLIQTIPKHVPLIHRLQLYHQKFNGIFFHYEELGSISLTLWDINTKEYNHIITKYHIEKEDLEDLLIVYDSDPKKSLHPTLLLRKLDLFRQGIELLFHIKTKPIFYSYS